MIESLCQRIGSQFSLIQVVAFSETYVLSNVENTAKNNRGQEPFFFGAHGELNSRGIEPLAKDSPPYVHCHSRYAEGGR